MNKFGLDTDQANAILEMQLRRLTGLEQDKIKAELTAIRVKLKKGGIMLKFARMLLLSCFVLIGMTGVANAQVSVSVGGGGAGIYVGPDYPPPPPPVYGPRPIVIAPVPVGPGFHHHHHHMPPPPPHHHHHHHHHHGYYEPYYGPNPHHSYFGPNPHGHHR